MRALDPARGGNVKVELAGGTYDLAAPLRFTAADSGSPKHPVVWKAAPGAHPVLSGAARVTDWSRTADPYGVWQASVPAGSATRQLYVNGVEAPVAQATPTQLGFTGNWSGSSTGYDISSDATAVRFFGSLTPAQLSQVEFSYPGGNGAWTQSECRVASYSNGQITMDEPCWQNVTNRLAFADGSGGLPSMGTSTMPTAIENARALLHPGQWFLDTSSDTLYFDGPQSMAGIDVELPRLESLLVGAGSLADPIHNLRFSGLQFSYATWNEPSSPAGFADVQSNLTMTLPGGNQGMCTFSTPAGTCPWGALTQPAVNVGFSGSNNVTFSGDRFVDLGGAGLGFEYGDHHDTVTRSLFDHIASTAVLLGCTYDPTPTIAADAQGIIQHCSLDPTVAANDAIGTNEILQHTTVSDNVIEHIGSDYTSASAVTLLFSQHTRIIHNDIFDVPYTGITAGVIQGHVDDQTHSQNSVNVNGWNTIGYNLIHDYMQVRDDGGAMYIEGHQAQYVYNSDGTVNEQATLAQGMHAIGNVAYNKVGFSPAMYDDAGSEYINWQNNVLFTLNGNSAQGGCDSTGPFGLEGNYASGGYESYFCLPAGVTIQTFASNNQTIPDSPGPNDLPASAIDGAGPPAGVARRFLGLPTDYYASPESAPTATIPNAVLLAGDGLSRASAIDFSGQPASAVHALSPGFVIATVPAGANSSALTVGNPPAAPTIATPTSGAVNLPGQSVKVGGAAPAGTTVTVTVDKQPLSGCSAAVTGGSWSCTLGPVAAGEHSLIATAQDAAGETANSAPTWIGVGGAPPASEFLNDTDPSFLYGPSWAYYSNRGYGDFGDDVHATTVNGDPMTFTFIGTGVQLYGELNSDQGDVEFSLDGGPQQVLDTSGTGSRQVQQVIFSATGLAAGQHTVTMTKLSGQYATFDGAEVEYSPSASSTGGTPPPAPVITSPSPGAVNVRGYGLVVSGTGPAGTTVTVDVDGQPFSGCSAVVSGGTWACTLDPQLAAGSATLTATATDALGDTSVSSGITAIYVDGVPPASLRLNDTDPSFLYDADWGYSCCRGDNDYGDDVHYAVTNGATLTYTFIGTGIKVYGEISSDQGDVGFSVDGGTQQVVDTSTTGARQSDQVIFAQSGLSPGQHTITITKLSGTYTTFDGVEIDYAPPGG
ncbi:MAG: Ig-like domain-containing protein [Conexibacteraceae bacterium]|nr:Ig-like domain-containing protein [Conexibacteraceae bacterium]